MITQQVRECFVPRPGRVFFQADYSQLELHTFAQVCIRLFGFSDLATALNSGLDPHVELAAEILQISAEEARARRELGKADKPFDTARQNAKAGNFGFPGGMGVDRFCASSEEKGIPMPLVLGTRIRNAWMKRWREASLYFKHVSKLTARGPSTLVDPFTGRVRGRTGYCDGCNDGFQALGAAVAKRACWLVSRACYAERDSVMYDSRIVNFVHDELIGECDDGPRAHDVAKELERLMVAAAAEYMPDVPAKAPPLLSDCWSKSAVAVYGPDGRLVPWRGDTPVLVARRERAVPVSVSVQTSLF